MKLIRTANIIRANANTKMLPNSNNNNDNHKKANSVNGKALRNQWHIAYVSAPTYYYTNTFVKVMLVVCFVYVIRIPTYTYVHCDSYAIWFDLI